MARLKWCAIMMIVVSCIFGCMVLAALICLLATKVFFLRKRRSDATRDRERESLRYNNMSWNRIPSFPLWLPPDLSQSPRLLNLPADTASGGSTTTAFEDQSHPDALGASVNGYERGPKRLAGENFNAHISVYELDRAPNELLPKIYREADKSSSCQDSNRLLLETRDAVGTPIKDFTIATQSSQQTQNSRLQVNARRADQLLRPFHNEEDLLERDLHYSPFSDPQKRKEDMCYFKDKNSKSQCCNVYEMRTQSKWSNQGTSTESCTDNGNGLNSKELSDESFKADGYFSESDKFSPEKDIVDTTNFRDSPGKPPSYHLLRQHGKSEQEQTKLVLPEYEGALACRASTIALPSQNEKLELCGVHLSNSCSRREESKADVPILLHPLCNMTGNCSERYCSDGMSTKEECCRVAGSEGNLTSLSRQRHTSPGEIKRIQPKTPQARKPPGAAKKHALLLRPRWSSLYHSYAAKKTGRLVREVSVSP